MLNFTAQLDKIRSQLPPMQIGKTYPITRMDRRLGSEKMIKHRHISHLWGVYPGRQVFPHLKTPETFLKHQKKYFNRERRCQQGLVYGMESCTLGPFSWMEITHIKLIQNQLKFKNLQIATIKDPDGGTYCNMF